MRSVSACLVGCFSAAVRRARPLPGQHRNPTRSGRCVENHHAPKVLQPVLTRGQRFQELGPELRAKDYRKILGRCLFVRGPTVPDMPSAGLQAELP